MVVGIGDRLQIALNEKETYMPVVKGDARELPEGFAPSEFDVLVGWARQNFHHGTHLCQKQYLE